MTIYKSEKGKEEILALYDKQLERLKAAYSDKYVSTSFGRTHLIETGNLQGIPLLVFHGGNATTAYNLLFCDFLMRDFHIYAVDTIGHPGKSAEVSLSARNYDYGKWASEVISAIGYESICCFGGSFGAGILAKTMCVAPEKIKRAVLYVPSGIKNAPAINSMSMMFPMIMYWITHKDNWLKKCMIPMAVTEENITDDIYETAKLSINHSKVKTGMPSNVLGKDMKKCNAPTLVMAAEKDCLFPAKGVLPRAKQIINNCTTYLVEGRGHMSSLTDQEKQMITEFLDDNSCPGQCYMSNIKLIKASAEYAEKILEYRAEFPTERMRVTYDPSRIPGMDYLEKYENVLEWLQFCEDMSDKITWYMAIRESDGKIVGFVVFRHKLEYDDDDIEFASNFGFSVRPSERGKGYAKEELRIGLQKAKELGLDKVRIVCRDINIGSNKTILANGGVYVDTIHGEISRRNINRYDIQLVC